MTDIDTEMEPADEAQAPALPRSGGVIGNARLTATVGVIMLALIGVQGATVLLHVRTMLPLHVAAGAVLGALVLVKSGAVGWRFLKYYRHAEPYRTKGTPHHLARVLGPLLVLATVLLFGSGILITFIPTAFAGNASRLHAVSAIVWALLLLAHLVVNLKAIRQFALRDWVRSRHQIGGAAARDTVILTALIAGSIFAWVLVAQGLA